MKGAAVAEEGRELVHQVAASDPPYLFHRGEGFVTHRLPAGARVIYPKPPIPGIPDVRGATRQAVENPLGCDPLSAQLRSGMRVTIAFDDISLPLPPMARPDVRQIVIETVVEILDETGIDDIELICAICLHRRMTPRELRRVLGNRVFNRFWPDHLTNHDAEDPEGNLHLGETPSGEAVEINRRAAESDLLIYVNINLVAMDGGHKSVPVGLGTYRSVRPHHNVAMMMDDSSYMDHARSAFHRSCDRMGAVVDAHVNVFTIETTLNSDTFTHLMGFLQRPEAEWSWFDRVSFRATQAGLGVLPYGVRRQIFHRLPAPYGVTAVHAGMTAPVHEKTLDAVHSQQLVHVDGQADIILVGLPYLGPYNVNSIMNPILVQCLSAGYFFNFHLQRPLIRRGGVMIVTHPIEEKFHPVHHPSYIDFYNNVLVETSDPAEMESRFEKSFAENPRYIDLYRNSYAYHGVHPFYMWYWGCHGMSHMGKVIAVAPRSPEAARRIGFEPAKSMDTAIGMARDFVGQDAQITYLHCPPIVMTEGP
jgi:hypothetical protein